MAYEMDHKTKDYIRRAQNNYNSKFDRITIRFPKGSSELIKEKTGMSLNNYIVEVVMRDLKENYGVELE